jgi:F-type H+-transporting ATPase subunit b
LKRALIVMLLAASLHAQERPPSAHEQAAETESGDNMLWWKWANFLILAGGLGYLISKNAGAFFRGRTDEIRKGISEAAQMKQEAETKVAEVERRMASLGAEIEKLRADAHEQIEAEGERLRREAEQNARRVQTQAEQEIEFMTKAARQEIRAEAANLALDLAAERARARMRPEIQHRLVDSFVAELRDGAGVQ